MRALIVGCGYVGFSLGAQLVRQGHEVFGLRRTDAGQDLKAVSITPLVGDLTSSDDLARLPGPFDWVIFTASASGGGLDDYRKIYFEGTRNLIQWLQATPVQKYVYTSSTGVYAQNDGSWVTEESLTEPASPTSQVLVETEKLLLRAWHEQEFPAIILRVAGIYGPGRGYPFRQFVKGEARIEGNGDRIMNMIHREDVAGAIITALERGTPGQIYNASDDEPVSQRDFYLWLSAALGKPLPPSVPEDPGLQRKRGITNKRVSNHKLKTELTYHFHYPTFREGYQPELDHLQAP